MKRYKLNERGKLAIMVIITMLVVGVATHIYLDRLEKINNGTFIVTSDCEIDK